MAELLKGQAAAAGLRLRGGSRLTRLLRRLNNPRAVARASAKVMRMRVLPGIRARAPRLTGALSSSLRIVQRSAQVQLRGIDYAPYVRFTRGGRRRSVAGIAHEELRRQTPQVQRDIVRELARGI